MTGADASDSGDLVAFVADVKRAIEQAGLQTPDLVVTRADLEIKTTVKGGLRVGGFTWGPVQIGGSYTQTQIAIVSLGLTPALPVAAARASTTDALTEAIASIGAAAREAARAEPRFQLEDATIRLNVGVAADGSLTVVAGGDVGSENVHVLTLTLATRS